MPRCFQVQKTVRARTVNLKDTGKSPRLLAVVSSWSTCQRSKPQLNMTGGPGADRRAADRDNAVTVVATR